MNLSRAVMDQDSSDSNDSHLLLTADASEEVLGQLFERYRPRLRRIIELRMAPQLKGRVDASDVLQEAFLDVAKRLPEVAADRRMSIFVWFRLVTVERLYTIHRQQIGTLKRDARRDVSLHHDSSGSQFQAALAESLVDQLSSVQNQAIRQEEREQVQAVINAMDELDREIIMMRIFESMTNVEVAETLELTKHQASRRFIRALRRLRRQFGEKLGWSTS